MTTNHPETGDAVVLYDSAGRPIKHRLRSKILMKIGAFLFGTPKQLHVPEDFFALAADRAFPGPGEDSIDAQRARIYTNRLRRYVTMRALKVAAVVNVVAALVVIPVVASSIIDNPMAAFGMPSWMQKQAAVTLGAVGGVVPGAAKMARSVDPNPRPNVTSADANMARRMVERAAADGQNRCDFYEQVKSGDRDVELAGQPGVKASILFVGYHSCVETDKWR